MNVKIFDAHIHVGAWGSHVIHERNIDPFRGRELDSCEKVNAYLDKSQIARAVAVPVYLPDSRQTYHLNDIVLEIAGKLPDKITPGFWIDPSPATNDHLKATLQLARDNSVYVLKTASQMWDGDYSPDPATWDTAFKASIDMILDFAQSTNSIIQMHTGSGKSHISLIERFIQFAGPGVRFHLVHMGGNVDGHFYLIPRLLEWRKKGFNVVCDTSWSGGFALRWISDLAAQSRLLEESILFASDEPWGTFQSELAKVIDATGGKSGLMEKILWENASAVYSRQTESS